MPEFVMPPEGVLPPDVPLCVDLDGTLTKSDTLHDSLLALLRRHPEKILQVPGWIAKGKARFKLEVTRAVELDVEHLPYNRPLLTWLRQEHGRGRAIYLATAADKTLAERVAAHIGIFAGVLASDGETNLAGGNKLAAFEQRFGKRGFCYIGNAKPDIKLLTACEAPMVANPHSSLTAGLKKAGFVPAATFEDRNSTLKSWLKAVRLHQWAKNVLIFVPLLLAHRVDLATAAGATTAFFSFGLCASATYIINDLLDIEADRRHPSKRRRPFAAGDLSMFAGFVSVGLLLALSVALAIALPHIVDATPGTYTLDRPYGFLLWLAVYTVTTLTYSFYLKKKLLLDVFVLSGLYTVRIIAGSKATGVPISPWLAGFSVFFFLSLAFVKRFSELEGLRERGGAITNGRGYFIADLEQLRSLGTGAAYASVVVMAMYVSNPETALLYRHLGRLWLVIPVLLLWLSQVWMLTSRGEMHDDPVVWACTDKRSLWIGALMLLVVGWAMWP
ncbi:UbiA family prenyltransferase [Granulicella cerasi]|uniref:UbiA family prenyltransferase n=1 Tax=Granulicella cerasi TaxID=741063 RepID=A0ABW1Z9V3_9BACT|nr:UbiA family prenyltransferase [Granulicella cerasi]